MKNSFTGKVSFDIKKSPADVWEALTSPELIRQYFFGTNTITDWKKGSPIIFAGTWEGKTYEDKGTILDIEPQKLLRYNYRSSMSGIEDKPENYAIITYTLAAQGNNITRLEITQENIPDEKMKTHSEDNWNKVLTGLRDLLEHRSVSYL
jgi:uncharacterized protein YndB with AHSA1/START domain